jgi:hypothetical protein
MSVDGLSCVEITALHSALSGGEPWKAALRDQVPSLHVIDRDYNSAGGYTTFGANVAATPAQAPETVKNNPPACLVSHASLPHRGEFIVWIEDGIIVCLEAIAHGDGVWPVNAAVEEFTFETEELD